MARNIKLCVYDVRNTMAISLADAIEAQLVCAITKKGSASFAVSGGSTPAALYLELSKRELDWSKVTVLLVDERWVPPGEKHSNETFMRETLLQNNAETAQFVGLWSAAPTPHDGFNAANANLDNVQFPLDVVVLGMGNDGHTASWFPHATGLSAALESAATYVAVTAKKSDVTGDNIMRMTMTLNAISKAGLVFLMIAGEEKRKVFETAQADGLVNDMPVRAIMDARPDMCVAWAP